MSFPCTTLTSLKHSLQTKLEEYKVVLEEVRVEGTVGSVQRLRDIEVELETLKTTIEEELNKAGYSLETATDANVINQKLKELGSKATIDTNIEGGIFTIPLTSVILKSIRTYSTATEAYEGVTRSPDEVEKPTIEPKLAEFPWNPIAKYKLEVLVLEYGNVAPDDREQLMIDMKKLGYRPLHLSELFALALSKPDLNRRDESFMTYEKCSVKTLTFPMAPILIWSGSKRIVTVTQADGVWLSADRLLFVRI